MIIDKLENLGKYVSLNPLFADVVTSIAWRSVSILSRRKTCF